MILDRTFVVADPLGGAAGERVTRLALAAMRAALVNGDLVGAIQHANAAVLEATRATLGLKGAGCTLAALELTGSVARVAWVGDVRLYRLRGETLEALTRDHSLVEDYLRATPDLTEAQRSQLLTNVMTRALGMREPIEVEVVEYAVNDGDLYVLASEGVYDALGDALLDRDARKHRDDPSACARTLLEDAQVNRGIDHMTVVVVAMKGGQVLSGRAGAFAVPD